MMYLALTVRVEESICTKIKTLVEQGQISYAKAYDIVKHDLYASQVQVWDKTQKDCNDLIWKLYSLANENN